MQGRSGALAVGSQLHGGRYVIEAVLGEGSFGITYRATNTGSLLHKQVAIKELFIEGSQRVAGLVLHPAGRSDESWGRLTANFAREAQTIARLKHPGIVSVYDSFAENDTLYIVMEFVDGTNLDRLVRQRGGHLPEAEALGYVAEVAAALGVLHQNGVLHRDIKPANIMIDKPGHAVLIDFGTARDFVPDKTLTHSVTLTPAFAPPEQFQPRARRGPFTDIYALAATTYWLLTGDLLDMWDTSKVNEDERLTPRVRTALTHALVFNPHERTPDAASFTRELLDSAAPLAASPPPPDPSATVNAPGYERNAAADADATASISSYQRNAAALPYATTVPNPPRNPAPAWGAETYDESRRGNPPPLPPYTASELASRDWSGQRSRSGSNRWLFVAGGVAAVALVVVLAFALLIGGGSGGSGSGTPTPGSNVAATQAPTTVEAGSSPPTNTTAPLTITAVPPTETALPLALDHIAPATLQMVSANEGWAMGGELNVVNGGNQFTPIILHYTSGRWEKVASPANEVSELLPITSLSMPSPNEGWAIGEKGLMLHYIGGSWIKVDDNGYDLTGVSMISPNEGWAVGYGGFLHYSAGQWTKADKIGTDLIRIYMTSVDEGWAVGLGGDIAHYSGGKWVDVNSDTYPNLYSAHPVTGTNGAVMNSGITDQDLYSVYMSSSSEGWAVGRNGTILHYSGDRWAQVSSPTGGQLYSVAMVSANEGWAVGENGIILHYSGGSWTKVSSPADVSLYSVAMVSANEGWAVGDGIILHYSGGSWTKVSRPADVSLYSVAMVSANEGWAVGDVSHSGDPLGVILHYQNGVWSVYH